MSTATAPLKSPYPYFETAMDMALSNIRDGTLSIDEDGRIWRHRNGGRPILAKRAESPAGKGYLRLTLGIPGTKRTWSVMAHRVIWTWLNGPIPEEIQINHKDLNKQNNRPDNLELATGSENIRHSYNSGTRPHPWHKATHWRGKPRVTVDQEETVCSLRKQGKIIREISESTGISMTHIQRILAKRGG